MENEDRVINISIAITQLEYDEIMSAIEYAMAYVSGVKEVLQPLRDKLYDEHGKPSWWRKD